MGAFGHKGPKRLDPGFEVLFQAFSGLMDNTGHPDGDPMRMGAAVCDLGTGLWTALGALAGLRQRERTGKGVVVNTSLLETAMFLLTTQFVSHKATGLRPVRHPTGSPRVVVFEAFDAADGRLLITAATDRLFKRLGRALGRADWAGSAAFEGNAARLERREEIVRDMQAVLAEGTVREWMEVFEAAGVPGLADQQSGRGAAGAPGAGARHDCGCAGPGGHAWGWRCPSPSTAAARRCARPRPRSALTTRCWTATIPGPALDSRTRSA